MRDKGVLGVENEGKQAAGAKRDAESMELDTTENLGSKRPKSEKEEEGNNTTLVGLAIQPCKTQ